MVSFDEIREALLARAEKAEAKAARLATECRAWRTEHSSRIAPPRWNASAEDVKLHSEHRIEVCKLRDAARAAVDEHGDLTEGGAE